jgi:tetratricopeptide (TPR) repeat protein
MGAAECWAMSRKRKRHEPKRPPPPASQPARTAAASHGSAAGTPTGKKSYRGILIVAIVTAVAGPIVVKLLSVLGLLGSPKLPAPREAPAANAVVRADFVGADRCATCHAAQYAVWKRSTHGRAGGVPSRDLVIAAFDGQPIRFKDAVVTPLARGTAYEFRVEQADEPVRTFRVGGVVGGGHMEGGGTQGFVSNRDDGTVRFLPWDWSRHGRFWFCNTNSRTNEGWVPITAALRLADCGDWPPVRVLGDLVRYANCQSCHASQLDVTLDTTAHRWDTRFTSLAINCEACHGPGRRHVELADKGQLAKGADIGFAALAAYGKDASLQTCYQCHAVKDQLHPGFLSGDSLSAYYSLKFPSLGDRPLLADGRVRTFAYQENHQYSDCYLRGGMTCTSCHDPHSQQYRDVNGVALPGRFDDRQCTSCHASKADRVAEHSHHRAGGEGSRCTSCHMPYLQQAETGRGAVRYGRSDHSIAIPRPAADSAFGVTSACLQCHARKPVTELQRTVQSWYGDAKPLSRIIAAQQKWTAGMSVPEAVTLLFGTADDTAGNRHAFARFAGMSRFLENYVKPDEALGRVAEGRLRALAEDADEDVRAMALATLHLSHGEDGSVRRALARALKVAGPHDAGLRARWALALGFMGDRYAGARDFTAAVVAFRRALEVTPGDARVLLNLANAQRDGGQVVAAVASYKASLAADGQQPLGLVNYGIALAAAGDTTAAIEAYGKAMALDSGEPLAYFNLANVWLVRGELDQAAGLYQKTVSLDPGLALAHFQLARVSLLKKAYPEALRSLRRGLMFDSTDATARATAAQLERDLARGSRGGG